MVDSCLAPPIAAHRSVQGHGAIFVNWYGHILSAPGSGGRGLACNTQGYNAPDLEDEWSMHMAVLQSNVIDKSESFAQMVHVLGELSS